MEGAGASGVIKGIASEQNHVGCGGRHGAEQIRFEAADAPDVEIAQLHRTQWAASGSVRWVR